MNQPKQIYIDVDEGRYYLEPGEDRAGPYILEKESSAIRELVEIIGKLNEKGGIPLTSKT